MYINLHNIISNLLSDKHKIQNTNPDIDTYSIY